MIKLKLKIKIWKKVLTNDVYLITLIYKLIYLIILIIYNNILK
jgi:hypothetical protein